MNIEKLLYLLIGNRVKQYRKALGYTQEKFVSEFNLSGVSLLSRIENGKNESSRNPRLLPKSFILKIKENHNEDNNNISLKELIWGTDAEQERLVQILLLAILMNGSINDKGEPINPFFYSDNYETLFPWAKYQSTIPSELSGYLYTACDLINERLPMSEESKIYPSKTAQLSSDKNLPTGKCISIKELSSDIQKHFENKYGFFFKQNNYDAFKILNTKYDEKNEKVSNLLLKSILNEPVFAQSFIMRLSNTFWNKPFLHPDNTRTIKHDIDAFILQQGNYGELILDFHQKDYYLFINAFNIFWEKKKKMYMEYFDKILFDEELCLKKGLGFCNNKDITRNLQSQDFINLNEQSTTLDMYYEEETIISNYYQQLTLQELFLRRKVDKNENTHDTLFWNYIADMREITMEYIKNRNANIATT